MESEASKEPENPGFSSNNETESNPNLKKTEQENEE